MGLSLVSKVSPIRMRGLMMGGWFVATGFGNKLTQIGQLWDDWLHSNVLAFLRGLRDGHGDNSGGAVATFEEGDARRVSFEVAQTLVCESKSSLEGNRV
jgi:hypothetical protein